MVKSFFLFLVAAATTGTFARAQNIVVKNPIARTEDVYFYGECIPLNDPTWIQVQFSRLSTCENYSDKDCQSLIPEEPYNSPRGPPHFQPANTITNNNNPNTSIKCYFL